MTVSRRNFLQSSFAFGVAACLPWPAHADGVAHRASVLDFGADPTGATDATEAVRKAIASLARKDARLVFPAGKYRFAASEETALEFAGFSGIEVYANNAQLHFAGNTVPFVFRGSKDVAVHDLTLDWERPSYSQGIVKETGPGWFTIAVDAAFPVTGTETITGFAAFAPLVIPLESAAGQSTLTSAKKSSSLNHNNPTSRPPSKPAPVAKPPAAILRPVLHGPNVRGLATSVSLVSPQFLRVAWEPLQIAATGITLAEQLHPGMQLVLLHGRVANACFLLEDCQGILLDEVTVRQAPGTAFLVRSCRDLTIEGVTVAASPATGGGSSHLLATGGDGLHCQDCHGSVSIKDTHFEGIAGDGINIYQSFLRIARRLDDRTVIVQGSSPGPLAPWSLPRQGDFLQLSEPANLQLLGEIGVSSAEPHPDGARLVFAETLSPMIVPGTLLCGVVDAPHVTIDHTVIANILGRGVMLHWRAEVTESHFLGCAEEAILLAPDSHALQGPAVQNIRVRNNTFEDCQPGGTGETRGIITVDTAQSAVAHPPSARSLPAMNSGVRIQGNTFIRSGGAAIFAAGVYGLVVTENTLAQPLGAVPSPGAPPKEDAAPAQQPLPVAMVLRDVADADVSSNSSNVQQTIALTRCAESVSAADNHLLTPQKPA